MKKGAEQAAIDAIMQGLSQKLSDLSYVKEGMRMLLQLQAYEKVAEIYHRLERAKRSESRICFPIYRRWQASESTRKRWIC